MREFQVIEWSCRPAGSARPNADRVVVTDTVVAVIDGSTPKHWQSGTSGADIAQTIADTLQAASPASSPLELLEAADAAVSTLYPPDFPPIRRACATLVLAHLGESVLVRVGDGLVAIADDVWLPVTTAEQQVAYQRQAVLLEALGRGTSVDELRESDPGRAAIADLLEEQDALRNTLAKGSPVALDGTGVPRARLEWRDLPVDAFDLVITSDGYLTPAATLSTAEAQLGLRLQADPLMIEAEPKTKGVALGAESFDDRSYIRVRVNAQNRGGKHA